MRKILSALWLLVDPKGFALATMTEKERASAGLNIE